MTINIALATSDAIVLGCDSVSSATRALVDPFNTGPAKDRDGKTIRDCDGNATISVRPDDIRSYVVNVVSGVEKMFPIHECQEGMSVAATTSGMAAVNGLSIKALADEFRTGSPTAYKTVEEVATNFLAFLRVRYEAEFRETDVPEEYWSELTFLVAGACPTEPRPVLYRVSVKDETIKQEFDDEEPTGIAWEGQADGVERLIGGYDSQLRRNFDRDFSLYQRNMHEIWSDRTAEIVADLVERLGVDNLPDDLDLSLPAPDEFEGPWNSARIPVQYSSLPLQYAIDFVGFLVTAQSGLQRFTSSIATVGGRTHIGVIRKGYNFLQLNEPGPVHRMTGFSDDA